MGFWRGPGWSVSCLFIARPFRRRGVSSRLLHAAVRFAADCGAKIIEGYPVVPHASGLPDVFTWTGLPSAFLRAGFREVARRSPTRPIVRWQRSQKAKRRVLRKVSCWYTFCWLYRMASASGLGPRQINPE